MFPSENARGYRSKERGCICLAPPVAVGAIHGHFSVPSPLRTLVSREANAAHGSRALNQHAHSNDVRPGSALCARQGPDCRRQHLHACRIPRSLRFALKLRR